VVYRGFMDNFPAYCCLPSGDEFGLVGRNDERSGYAVSTVSSLSQRHSGSKCDVCGRMIDLGLSEHLI
jgi:hypothetical protein